MPSTPPNHPGLPPGSRIGPAILGAALGLGAVLISLVATRSAFFDLDRHQVPKELVLHGTALVGLAVLLPGWRRIRLTPVDLLLLLALLWTWASTLLATNPWIAGRAAGVATSAFVVYLMGKRIAGTPAARIALAGMVAAVAVAALIGAAEAFGLNHPVFATERVPGGTFGNRNFLAHFVAIGLPMVLLMAIAGRRWWARAGGLVMAGLLIGLIVLTRSRAAWLASAMAGGVMLLAAWQAGPWRASLAPNRRAALILAITVGIVAALVLPNQLDWKSDSPYTDTVSGLIDYRSGSGKGRLVQWRNSVEMIPDDPVFGVGPGNWFVHYPRVTEPGDPAFAGYDAVPTNPWPSSDWVAFLTEIGIAGTLWILLAGAAIWLTSWRRTRSEDPEEAGRGLMLVGMIMAALVTAGFDAVLHLAAPAYLLASATGLLLPATKAVVERELSPLARRGLASLALLVGLALVLQSTGQQLALRATRDDRRRAAVQEALRFDPMNFRLHLRLAQGASCRVRLPHAERARALLPYHEYPRRVLKECGR